jgi:sugar fermentation stimulation protein A
MLIEFKPTVPAIFAGRPNRFVALVELNGSLTQAHIATSGRLHELLVVGARVLLEKSSTPARKTQFSLRAVEHEGIWVSIDAQVPNRLVEKALVSRALPPFAGCDYLRREPAYDDGRLDFLLEEKGKYVYIEVKSVTLVEGRTALFPDAPTVRGSRHLHKLHKLAVNRQRAAVLFIVQREDAYGFAANNATDPIFAAALREAVEGGVEVYAYGCRVDAAQIELLERLPVMV